MIGSRYDEFIRLEQIEHFIINRFLIVELDESRSEKVNDDVNENEKKYISKRNERCRRLRLNFRLFLALRFVVSFGKVSKAK